MELGQVGAVLGALEQAGCPSWVDGGWGIDALVGHQTRAHRDLDLCIDQRDEPRVLATLTGLGYAVETDWRPTRVELAAPGRGWVDVHPLVIDASGVRQAALDGGWHHYPDHCFTLGRLEDLVVPCFTVEAQRFFHTGYELREVDVLDLAQLDRLEAPGRPRP